MKRVAVILTVLVVGTVVAWTLRGSSHEEATPASGAALDRDDGVRPSDVVPAGLQAGSAAPDDRPRARGGRGSIVGTVRRRDAATAARIEITFVAEPGGDPLSGPGTTAYLWRMLDVPARASRPTASASASADGRYVVDGLAPGVYRATAIAADGASGSATATLAVEGARAAADVRIGEGAETLTGRIMHADGRPFLGAVFVEAALLDPWGIAPGGRVTTDATGRFVARGLETGKVIVTAIERGVLRTSSSPVAIPHVGEYVLIVDAGATLRHGRVVAAGDGSPVGGATVIGGGKAPTGESLMRSTTTDAEGRFAITLPKDGGGLRALAAGFAPLRRDLSELPLGGAPIELRLARGARLEGRVTSATDGTPVPGVGVRVLPHGRATRYFPPEPATTDADGRFALSGLPAGEATAFAQGSGWVADGLARPTPHGGVNPLAVTLKEGETATLDFQLVRAVSVAGIVRDAAGAPIGGAVVRAVGRQSPGSYYWLGAIENVDDVPTATAADGSFTSEGLVGGANYVFTATTPDGERAHSSLVTVSAERPTTVEISLAPMRRLEVVVLDADSGNPVAGARVVAFSAAASSVMLREHDPVVTDAEGRAIVVRRFSGPVRLSVYSDDHVSVDETPVVDDDPSPVVRLDRAFVISGRVVLPDGSSAAGVDVESRSEEGNPDDPGISACTSDANGAFRLSFGSAGARTIRATHRPGGEVFEAVAVVTAGGAPIVMTLGPPVHTKPLPGTLVVRVVAPDGKPVPSARAQFVGANHQARANHQYETVRDGRVTFHASDRKGSWVEVWDAETSDGDPLPFGPARHGPIAAETDEIVLRLPPERRIHGVLRGPDGRGVRGAVVSAKGIALPCPEDGASSSEATTDADGTFRIGRLGEGEYSLTAVVPPEFLAPEPTRAQGGATGVEIVLRAATRVQITVVDDAGKRVPDADVSVHGTERSSWSRTGEAKADANGVARLGGLDASLTYTLEVRAARADWLPYSEEAWTPADVRVRLERAYVVSGVVRDRSGRPVARAQTSASTDDTYWNGGWTDADGKFSIGGLRPGTVVVSASLPGRFGGGGPEVAVAAGTRDVVLIVDSGAPLVVHVGNWPAGQNESHRAMLFEQGRDDPAGFQTPISSDGKATFRGVAPDRDYMLWIAPVGNGLSLVQHGVRAAVRDVHVSLVPGKSITGRLTVPPRAERVRVVASREAGHMTVSGSVNADGTYEILGLPVGRWSIEAYGVAGRDVLAGEGVGAAGERVDIDLRAE